MKKLRYLGTLLILGLLALLSLAYRSPIGFLQATETPLPKGKLPVIPLEAQAGHTDGIVVLGIFIFIFIAFPIILSYRNWRSS